MRGYIGRGLVGEDLYTDGLSRFQGCIDEQEKYGSDMLKFVLSPHAIYTCSEKLLRQVTEESEKRGMLRQTHLSESETEVNDAIKKFGRTPVEVMRDTGFLGKKESPEEALFGAHPSEEGCAIWANALYKELLKK